MRIWRLHRGFSLVEVLVAMAIGLFLTAGIVQMFVANKQSYRFNEALARMQESGRYALDLIASDLRMADFWGCAGPDKITESLNPVIFGTPPVGLEGIEGATAADSDTIEIRGATEAGLVLAAAMAGGTGPVVVKAPVHNDCPPNGVPGVGELCPNDPALVSDCRSGRIFQVTNIQASGGNVALSHAGLSEVYDRGASVYAVRTLIYDIGIGVGGQPSLRRREGNSTRPVAEGIAGMQITYGRDLDLSDRVHRAAQYVPAPAGAAPAWFSNVVSVRVTLLLRSMEPNIADAPQQLTYNGQAITCPDRRICQVMTGTFAIRNRVQ